VKPSNQKAQGDPPKLYSPLNVKVWLNDETGIVESVLTMIPVLLLFLTLMQIGVSALARTVYSVQADQRATAMSFDSANNSIDAQLHNTALPGGGSINSVEQSHHLSSITPLLPQGDQFTSSGSNVQ
jgi:hypothetical protein